MARLFNGTSDFAQVTRTLTLEPAGTAISVGLWVQGTAPGNFKYLLSKVDVAGDHPSYGFSTNGSGDLRFIVGNSTSFTVSATIAAASVFDNAWHQVLGVYNGVDIRIYLDGTLQGSPVLETRAVHYNTAEDLWFGSFDGSQLFVAAALAHMAIWSSALSSTDATTLAGGAVPSTVQSATCIAYWPFDGSVNPEPDNINSQDATVTGTTQVTGPAVGGGQTLYFRPPTVKRYFSADTDARLMNKVSFQQGRAVLLAAGVATAFPGVETVRQDAADAADRVFYGGYVWGPLTVSEVSALVAAGYGPAPGPYLTSTPP